MFGGDREGGAGGPWSFVVLVLGRLARETGARKDASSQSAPRTDAAPDDAAPDDAAPDDAASQLAPGTTPLRTPVPVGGWKTAVRKPPLRTTPDAGPRSAWEGTPPRGFSQSAASGSLLVWRGVILGALFRALGVLEARRPRRPGFLLWEGRSVRSLSFAPCGGGRAEGRGETMRPPGFFFECEVVRRRRGRRRSAWEHAACPQLGHGNGRAGARVAPDDGLRDTRASSGRTGPGSGDGRRAEFRSAGGRRWCGPWTRRIPRCLPAGPSAPT